MPVKQRVVEHIIPKKLALIDRVWTNADQSKTTQTYMARLWQPTVKRYSFIKLESTSVHNAKQECFEHWTKHAGDIKDGRDIGSYHRKLRTFIDEFVEFLEEDSLPHAEEIIKRILYNVKRVEKREQRKNS